MKTIAKALTISVLASLLWACSSSDNLQKPSPLAEFKPKIKVQKVWSQSTGGSGDSYLNLQIGYTPGNIYTVSYKGVVYDFNANTGDEKWRTKLDKKIMSGISVANNIAIVAASNGDIIALNANNGSILWQTNVGNQVLGKAGISKNVVVVKTVADAVYALRTSDGKQLWSYSGDAPLLILRGGSQPQIVANKVVIGFADGKLGEFDLSKGTSIWQQVIAVPEGGFPVQRMVDISASPQISNGVIYTATYQGNIAAVEEATGQIVWNHKLSSYTGLALLGSHIYVSDAKSHVWNFQQEDGGVLWRQKALEARGISAPALLGKYVIVGDQEGYVHWLSQLNGQFVAREKLSSDAIRSAPVIMGDMLYVLDVDGDLAAYKIVATIV